MSNLVTPDSRDREEKSGEHQRCLHCHAMADVVADPEVRFVCAVCGGVRIPIDDPAIERAPASIELLKKTTVARSARLTWGTLASVAAGFGVFSVLVLWLVISVAHPPVIGGWAAGLAALVPFAFAFFAARQALAWKAIIARTLDQAWKAAVQDIAHGRSDKLSAPMLATLTRTDESAAHRLLESSKGN